MTPARIRRLGLGLLLLAAPACSTQPAPPPDKPGPLEVDAAPTATQPLTASNQAAPPDPTLMSFDASNRTLTLYALPARGAHWMLHLPEEGRTVPLDREYRFPEAMELDYEEISVFYLAPNQRPSDGVTLQEILDAGTLAAAR